MKNIFLIMLGLVICFLALWGGSWCYHYYGGIPASYRNDWQSGEWLKFPIIITSVWVFIIGVAISAFGAAD